LGGESDLADIGGAGGAGGAALGLGLTVDVPGDGGEGVHGDKAGGAGGSPRGAGRCRGGGGGLERLAPGRPAPGQPRQRWPAATRVLGEPFASRGRGSAQSVVREARRRAAQGAAGLRDGAGAEAVRPGPRLVQVVGEPLRGVRRLPRRAMPGAPGMLDTGVSPTVWARARR